MDAHESRAILSRNSVPANTAVAKWCPFSRTMFSAFQNYSGNTFVVPANRDNEGAGGTIWGTHCLGQQCMAWRTVDSVRRRVHLYENPQATKEPPQRPSGVPQTWVFAPFDPDDQGDPACWVEPYEEAELRTRGYCGLATMPPLIDD